MGIEEKAQQVNQMLKGVYRMCAGREECEGCPFCSEECVFGEPKPNTWFDKDSINSEMSAKELAEAVQPPKPEDEEGSWLVSTSMGSVFSKYVFICSKCGYKQESHFSITPMNRCPECAKRKQNQ